MSAPSGLPLKVEAAVRVLNAKVSAWRFTLASDTFEGSSGSGIFDSQGHLVGIVARGAVDYVRSDAGCSVANTGSIDAPPGGGEQAVYLAPIVDALCATDWNSEALCPRAVCESDCDGAPTEADELDAGSQPSDSGF